jgi:hypothetical protein
MKYQLKLLPWEDKTDHSKLTFVFRLFVRAELLALLCVSTFVCALSAIGFIVATFNG